MKTHKSAQLTPLRREEMAQLVIALRPTTAKAVRVNGVCAQIVACCSVRYRKGNARACSTIQCACTDYIDQLTQKRSRQSSRCVACACSATTLRCSSAYDRHREPGAPQGQLIKAFAPRTSPTGAGLTATTSGRVDPSGHQDDGALQQSRPAH